MQDGPRKIEITDSADEQHSGDSSEQTFETDEAVQTDDTGAAEGAPDGATTTGEEEATVEELRAEVERLRQELAEEHDRHLRAVAELQNYRRRTAREQQERQKYAGQSVLSAILPVMDNLRRVLEHQAEAGTEDFAKGVEMTVEEFFRVLSQFGVTVIDCEGEPFDPALHEAVARAETSEVPEGTVVAVDTPGYCLHDRCLRPARVVVAAQAPDED